jgi:uncharacterized protein involved in exopolysaccharide biosynthesis
MLSRRISPDKRMVVALAVVVLVIVVAGVAFVVFGVRG